MTENAKASGRATVLKTVSAMMDGRGRFGRALAYRRKLAELSALSDRELREMGLSRAMLRPVARQAAQAA